MLFQQQMSWELFVCVGKHTFVSESVINGINLISTDHVSGLHVSADNRNEPLAGSGVFPAVYHQGTIDVGVLVQNVVMITGNSTICLTASSY